MAITVDALRDYSFWLKHTPQEILNFAEMLGGWDNVFPKHLGKFPGWASRVRNYFNLYPRKLKLLKSGGQAEHRLAASLRRQGIKITSFGAAVVFDDQVYLDELGRPWFLYGKSGSAFHYESMFPNDAAVRRAATAAMTPRDMFPVFKLISPDRAGGSSEVVIHNWEKDDGGRSDTIRDMSPGGRGKSIKNHIVIKPEYKGSYNYTCAMFTSNPGHTYRDVDPDKVGTNPLFLIEPAHRGDLMSRKFPRKSGGKDLAPNLPPEYVGDMVSIPGMIQ